MDKKDNFIIVGIGEVLWDCFGQAHLLGGAPFNFAYHARALGDEGVFAGRVGDDADGGKIRKMMLGLGLSAGFLQSDKRHPTGRVDVTLSQGQPSFVIHEGVAWDHLRLTAGMRGLAEKADAVCFGTLAQRCAPSRRAIRGFLECCEGALVVCDLNLRQRFYTRQTIADSLAHSDILKLNAEEAATLQDTFGRRGSRDSFLDWLAETSGLEMVCVTKGELGCDLRYRGRTISRPGRKVQVADTVGAGDAFTAALVHKLLRGAPPGECAEFANRAGALVASRRGATPAYTLKDI